MKEMANEQKVLVSVIFVLIAIILSFYPLLDLLLLKTHAQKIIELRIFLLNLGLIPEELMNWI